MRTRILTTIGLGLVLVGCEGRFAKDVPMPAQSAALICAAYGLRVPSPTYETCVAYQEARAQSYPGQSIPPFRLDQHNNRVDAEGYRVDGTGHRMSVQSPYSRF